MTTALREKVRSLEAVTPVRGGGFLFFYRNILLAGILLIATLSAQAATYYVSPSGNDANSGASLTLAKQTIQAAINISSHGDTILVSDGTYSPITVEKEIIVRSVNGAPTTIIDGGGVRGCVYLFSANAVLDGFTLINGHSQYADYGGGITANGGTTVRNCTISGNTAYYGGGGISTFGGTVENCTISGNTGANAYAGGVYVSRGIVRNCTIKGNVAHGGSGGVTLNNSTVKNCLISGNRADDRGGGVQAEGGTVENCTISGNMAEQDGGGVYLWGSTVKDCTISENVALLNGGGAYLQGGTVENCAISRNISYGSRSTPTTIYECGGGVYLLWGGTVRNCTITENIALWDGGGAFLWGGTIENCTISMNDASSFGGGVTLINGTVKNCLINGNRANDLGGGVEAEGGLVENCTITRNTVLSESGSSGLGGGLYIQAGTVRNSIVYYNEGQDVMGPNMSSISYSCLGTNIPGTGNISNEPEFVSNGSGYGPNYAPGNYRLRPTSPCINAGLNQSWMAGAIDLDGLPRVLDSVVDMGAYEGLGANNAIMRNPAILYNQCSYGSNAASQTIEVWNAGTNAMAYALSADVGWISLSPASGTSMGEIDLVSVNYASAGLLPGTYTGVVTITSAEAINSPQVVTVYLTVDEEPPDDEDPPESVADLEASDFRFLPVNLWAGDHPAMISFDLVNEGPEDIVAPDTQLEISFYLSSNTIFGDSDDLTIGTKTEELTLSAGSQATIRYPGRAHNTDITIPEGLSGDFYVFVSVRLVSQVGLTDPDGAVAMREGPIRVRIHPSDDEDDSRQRSVLNDYDADGQSDMMEYDEESGEWVIKFSASGATARFIFGGPDYEAVSGDYDGDFKTDPAVHERHGPAWQIMLSGLGYETVSFGFDVGAETRGAVGDYNGDELADPGLYEEQSGRWYVLVQDKRGNFEIASALFGGSGFAPVVGDYDGDSRADPALYEETTGNWLVMLSALEYGVANAGFGGPGYRPVPADYDGDGKTDLAIMDASGGWYYRLSGRSYALAELGQALSGPDEFGKSGRPVAGDYDGDGKSDPAVVSATGWYFWLSGSSYTRAGPYALNGR